MNLNSQNFPEVYKWLDINLTQLGCVMLPLEFTKEPEFMKPLAYKSPDPEKFWIDGWVAEKKAHMTILYGLLNKPKSIELSIRKVLKGWSVNEVEVGEVGFFPSPYPEEKYWCIIAHILVTPDILEGHQRLSFLPHINTFPNYTPHTTLGYIQCSEDERDKIIGTLKTHFVGRKLKVTGDIDLGRP